MQDPQGQANAGVAYATGRGLPLNYIEAYVWLGLAAAHGDSGSAKAQKRIRELMTTAQLKEAEYKAKTTLILRNSHNQTFTGSDDAVDAALNLKHE